jgi:hypothetical protein
MGYQSKTYSLSDEVVERLESEKALGRSPNQFLLTLIALYDAHGDSGCYVVQPPKNPDPLRRAAFKELPDSTTRPRPHTVHSGVRPVPNCKQCEDMK